MEILYLNSKHVTRLIENALLRYLKLTCVAEGKLNPQIPCSQLKLLTYNPPHHEKSQLRENVI
jgi:hypothetical protein